MQKNFKPKILVGACFLFYRPTSNQLAQSNIFLAPPLMGPEIIWFFQFYPEIKIPQK